MIRIIWNAFLLGLIALAAAWLGNNAGSIQIDWIGYRITTSVAVFIGAVVLFYFIFHYLLAKPISLIKEEIVSIFRSDARAERIAKAKVAKEMDRYILLGKGITALMAGDIATAEKLKRQIEKKFVGEPGKTMVFEAQLAEAKNDTAEALHLYSELAKEPETKLLGLRGKIRLFRLSGNVKQALDICSVLLNEKNPPLWVISESFELQLQERRWVDAVNTLEKARKQDIFDKATFKHLKACVLLEQSTYEEDPELKEKLVRDAENTDGTLAQAVLLTAKYNAQKGQLRKARSQLMDLWKKSPNWAVYEAYVSLTPEATPIDTVKNVEELIRENPSAVLNDLILADSSIKAQLWGQAKTSLEKYLQSEPFSKKALTMMAEVAERSKDEAMASEYKDRAAQAEDEAPYRCSVCLTEFNDWHVVCPVCHTLGTTTATF